MIRARSCPEPSSRPRPVLVATVNPTFVANENATVLACCFVRPRAAVVMKSPLTERGTDVRMGDQDVAEALSRSGRFAVRAGAAVRDRSHDDLALGQDGAAGPGPVGRFERIFAAASGDAQARPLQGDHRRAPRGVSEAVGEAAVRRGPRGGLSGLLRGRAELRASRPSRPGCVSGASRYSSGKVTVIGRQACTTQWSSCRFE